MAGEYCCFLNSADCADSVELTRLSSIALVFDCCTLFRLLEEELWLMFCEPWLLWGREGGARECCCYRGALF